MGRARTFLFLSGVVWALCASASAQEAGVDRTAAARELFEQGVEQMDRQHWADAAELFQRALQLRVSPQITYNLALCLSRDNRVVRAVELMRQLSRDPTTSPDARARADALIAEATPRIAHLTLRVVGELGARSVLVDERPIDVAMLDVAIPVDPGAHTVSVRRQGRETISRDIRLGEGESSELELDLEHELATPEEAARTVVTPPTTGLAPATTADEGGNGVLSEWWFWTGVGVIVVGAVAVVLALTLGGTSDPVIGNGDPGVIRLGGGT